MGVAARAYDWTDGEEIVRLVREREAKLTTAIGQGIAVPEEISVAGFDDTPVCEMVSPALTTVRQDGAARARIAMAKLLALREGRTVGEEVILPVTLVVRGSTRIRK